ncbi:PQQ-dependent sugar dehydrogenase [Candidatus Poriferisodalis sp.]|uniref:PQQ-dependent sugar dehydrogenase n=1 Tax=Candidatus Poriferisodalis sp. TaxID=3101277 RepID=UPI003B02DF01
MRGRRLVSGAVCAAAIVASCSQGGTVDGTDPAPGSPLLGDSSGSHAEAHAAAGVPLTQTPEYLASNTPCPAELPELGAVPLSQAAPGRSVQLTPFVELADATVMVFDNAGADGGGYVGDRSGRIWRFEPNPADRTSTGRAGSGLGAAIGAAPIADFSSDTAAEHDQGLVGMTLGPTGRLWINRTNSRGTSVLTVLTPNADHTRRQGGHVDMLEVKQTNAQHNGGDLLFDQNRLLYVSFGDGGGQGDPRHHGQNRATPLGAVLRFAVAGDDGTDLGQTDPDEWRLVPAPGNPDLGPDSDPNIWAYGVRNPYRMSIDQATGTLWIADVGQQCMEEITVLGLDENGANLGWNAYEGSRRFFGDALSTHRPPDLEYRHGRGLCAVIGGHVYRGEELPWLAGRYVFADLCGGDIYAASVQAGAQPDDVWHLGIRTNRPVGFAVDPAGELYVIDMETGAWRITDGSSADRAGAGDGTASDGSAENQPDE